MSPRDALSILTLTAALAVGAPLRAQEPPAAPNAPVVGRGRGLELTLQDALGIALQNNLGLQIEGLASDIARYQARGSWGAFDWVLNARAGLTDSEIQAEDIFAGAVVVNSNSQNFGFDLTKPLTTGGSFRAQFDTTNTKTNSGASLAEVSTSDIVALTYSQPLWRGAWREYATSVQREAGLEERRQSEHEREVSQKLLLDTSVSYWDLVSAREQLEVADSGLGLARQQVEQNQRRLDAGVGTEVEVLQADAEVSTREEQRLLAEVRTRQTADALMKLLFPGTDEAVWETTLVPRTPLPESVSTAGLPGWTDAFAVALEQRTELVQQRLAIEAAVLRHERSRSEKHPGLDLDLSASSRGFDGDSSDAFDKAIAYDFPTYSAAVVFNVPFSNTRARYSEKVAWAALRQARLAYDEMESQIVAQVRESVRQVSYQSEAVRAASKSRELADRQLKAEQARYDEGLSTTFQVLQFQQDFVAAMSRERTSRVNYAKALVALTFSQGILGADLKR